MNRVKNKQDKRF